MKKSVIINHIHSVILLYLLLGWMIESQREVLVFFLPTLQYQFLVNDNMCILTQLENKFLKDEKNDDKEIIISDSFINKKLEKFNISISPEKREYMIHSFVYGMFVFNYFLM